MDGFVHSPLSTPPTADDGQSCQIFVFGDLSISFRENLRQLLHTKCNETLRSFFEQVGFAFRQELAKLPASQQDWFPCFTTLVDLLSKLGETEGTPALEFALVCICQIGQFIRYELQSHSYSLGIELIRTAQILRRRIETFSQCLQQLPVGSLHRFICCCCNQYLSNTS